MRVVFMGTPDFALPTLQALADSTHEVVAVYTAPPRPAHRGKKITISPVHKLADSLNLPVHTPIHLKNSETQRIFAQHNADIAIVVAYGLLLPNPILTAYPYGCVNIHPSRLPRWRGAAPIQRSIMAGDAETSICIMQMDIGLDTGAVLMEEPAIISPEMNAIELEHLLSQRAAPLLIQTLQGLMQGTLFAMPQLTDGVKYAAKIDKLESILDFSKPAHELVNHLRGLSPFPGAYFTFQGERIKILKAEVINTSEIHSVGIVLDDKLTIQCGLHAIRPIILQRANRTAQAASEVLRGLIIPIGTQI